MVLHWLIQSHTALIVHTSLITGVHTTRPGSILPTTTTPITAIRTGDTVFQFTSIGAGHGTTTGSPDTTDIIITGIHIMIPTTIADGMVTDFTTDRL